MTDLEDRFMCLRCRLPNYEGVKYYHPAQCWLCPYHTMLAMQSEKSGISGGVMLGITVLLVAGVFAATTLLSGCDFDSRNKELVDEPCGGPCPIEMQCIHMEPRCVDRSGQYAVECGWQQWPGADWGWFCANLDEFVRLRDGNSCTEGVTR